ncbi:MAG: hypothetical protein R3F17_06475 [Planctomycetota bacterium]
MGAGEILVADDNDPGGNHRTTTVALFGDNVAHTFEIVLEREARPRSKEDEFILVGPQSWHEDLQKLSLD